MVAKRAPRPVSGAILRTLESPADLHERYNLLFLKVLSLLQDDDPPLFRDIAASREAIWDLLADPVEFKTLSKEAKS